MIRRKGQQAENGPRPPAAACVVHQSSSETKVNSNGIKSRHSVTDYFQGSFRKLISKGKIHSFISLVWKTVFTFNRIIYGLENFEISCAKIKFENFDTKALSVDIPIDEVMKKLYWKRFCVKPEKF